MAAPTLAETKRVESIAFLALAYSELSKRDSSAGLCGNAEVFDEIESNGPELTLLRVVSESLSPTDWTLVRALRREPDDVIEWFADKVEPFRVEALVHALVALGRSLDDIFLPVSLALDFARRWDEVEEWIEFFRSVGLVASREDIEDTFVGAVATATGRGRLDVWE
jgi:hypothetical protein